MFENVRKKNLLFRFFVLAGWSMCLGWGPRCDGDGYATPLIGTGRKEKSGVILYASSRGVSRFVRVSFRGAQDDDLAFLDGEAWMSHVCCPCSLCCHRLAGSFPLSIFHFRRLADIGKRLRCCRGIQTEVAD